MSSILRRNAINKDFSRNPQMKRPRSLFKGAHKRITTLNGSYLVPIYLKETVPGDSFSIDMSLFSRIMPQVTAVMDKAVIKTYFFWERNINLWENFYKMMGERRNPNDTIDYTVPTITIPSGGFDVNTIYDYMNIPLNTGAGRKISALPFRMYNRIWNKYFRSEQLQNEVTEKYDDTDDSYSLYTLLKKNKIPDYFTRNLTDTQMGDGVNIPLGTEAPVVGNGQALGLINSASPSSTKPLLWGTLNAYDNSSTHHHALLTGDGNTSNKDPWYNVQGGGELIANKTGPGTDFKGYVTGVTKDARMSGLIAKLNESASASIIAFRTSMAMERVLESDNRAGVRMSEILASRYGVVVPDEIGAKPIYLGGTAVPLSTIPVTQTSSTDSTTPQGNLTGNTIGIDRGKIEFSVPDFGYVMGLVCISVEPQYQQGLPRLFDRQDRYAFYHPEFNGVGDQATYNSEIYLQDESVVDSNGTPKNDLAFGYNERLSEYKTSINEVTGYMRSTAPLTLDSWGYWEKFENMPTLNSTFITDKAEECIKRTLAVKELTIGEGNNAITVNAPQCLLDMNFVEHMYRGMPVYNLPSIAGL